MIIENSFTCIEEMVDHMFPFFKPLGALKQRLLRLKWRSIDVIHLIDVPLLMLSSDKDEIVPNSHMHRLKEAATGSSALELHTFPNATHNDIFQVGGDRYWTIKRNFIDKVMQAQDGTSSAAEATAAVIEVKLDELRSMKPTELKELAQRCRLNLTGCAEKQDIIDRFQSAAPSEHFYLT